MRKELLLIGAVIVILSSLFFYPIFSGKVPFPGDLLVGGYTPYNSYPFQGYAPGGYPNKGQDFDVIRLLFPLKKIAIDSFKEGQFPLWNSYNFSGNPLLASIQAGAFYPFNIIFFLLPFNLAWSLYILIQPVLIGIFTYLFLKELNLSKKSSLLGSLTFAFSSYLVVWLEYGNMVHSIIWMPLVMWLSIKNLKESTVLKSILIIFMLTFSVLAGHIQIAIYLYLFVFIFIISHIFFVDKKNIFKKITLFAIIFLLSILLSAAQLIPSIELFLNSARSSYTLQAFIKLLIPQFHLVTLFVPDFFGNPATRNYWLEGTYIERVSYIGVLPLLFAAYGFRKKNFYTWFFSLSIVFLYLFCFNSYFSRFFYSLNIPILSTSVPSRMMFFFCFSASILAAFGFNAFEKNTKGLTKTVFLIGSIYGLLWIIVFFTPYLFKNLPWVLNLMVSKRNLIFPSMIFLLGVIAIFLANKSAFIRKNIFIIILVITLFDLFYFFQKITPFAPIESIYPKTEVLSYLKSIQNTNRSWGYGSAYIETNIQTQEKLFSTNGYDALHIKRYGELVSASKEGKIASNLPRSESEIASGYGQDDLRNNYYRQKLLNLLNVKYILHKNALSEPDYQTFDKSIYEMIWQKDGFQIFENKNALPRAFLTSSYVVETEKEKIIERIFDKDFNLKNTVILEEELPPGLKLGRDNNAKVEIISYKQNEVIVSTNSSKDSMLFVSDNYYPGWHAVIDGQEVKIFRADYAFRAVPVKSGKHEIVFWYYPKSFELGLKISLATLILLISITVLKLARKSSIK